MNLEKRVRIVEFTEKQTVDEVKSLIQQRKSMLRNFVIQFYTDYDFPYHIEDILDRIRLLDVKWGQFYWDMADILKEFLVQWEDAIKNAKRFHLLLDRTRNTFEESVTRSMQMEKLRQERFKRKTKELLKSLSCQCDKPLLSTKMIREVDEMERATEEYLKELKKRLNLMLDLKSKEDFRHGYEKELELSIELLNDVYVSANTEISYILEEKLPYLEDSLVKNLSDVQKNIQHIETKMEEKLKNMKGMLYEEKKQLTALQRQNPLPEMEIAEIQESISELEGHYLSYDRRDRPWLTTLRHQQQHLRCRLEDLQHVTGNILALNRITEERCVDLSKGKQEIIEEREYLLDNEDIYSESELELKLNQLQHRYKAMKTLFDLQMNRIQESRNQNRDALLSVLAVPGRIRVTYVDKIGEFYLNEYGHKVYTMDNTNKTFVLDCQGRLVPSPDKSYDSEYDDYGRYYIDEHNAKVYVRATGTSQYKLDTQKYHEKLPITCGNKEIRHDEFGPYYMDKEQNQKYYVSEKGTEYMFDDLGNFIEMEPRDEPLPEADFGKDTIDTKTMIYLRQTLYPVVTKGLDKLLQKKPKDPINYLAHWLIDYRHNENEAVKKVDKQAADKEECKNLEEEQKVKEDLLEAWRGTCQPPKNMLEDEPIPYNALHSTAGYHLDDDYQIEPILGVDP